MAGRVFVFDPPDRFVAGSVGQPGHRTFFLQATKGSAMLSVAVEKVQVAFLAKRIAELVEELRRRRVELPRATVARPAAGRRARRADLGGRRASSSERMAEARRALADAGGELAEPVVEAFRIGAMTVTYDGQRRDLMLEARELGGEGDAAESVSDGDGSGHLLRVRLTLGQAIAFARRAMEVVASGRPPCPVCGEPLDPQGHICLRRNGYMM